MIRHERGILLIRIIHSKKETATKMWGGKWHPDNIKEIYPIII